jgi:hypothetical protein
MNIRKTLAKNYVNFRGWSSSRKIVVIESDDWGSIRMPSKEVYEKMRAAGVQVDNNYFTAYDCLESKDDLEVLFELLSSYIDINGNHPVITANAVVANPDFKRIQQTGKTEYHYELITDTYNRYPNHNGTFELWKNEGIKNRLLWPQFHGREHLNVKKWMKAINSEKENERLAFENEVLLGVGGGNNRDYNYMAAFEYSNEAEQKEIEAITADGLNIFNKLFGFGSESFVASCSVRGDHLDTVLKQNGVLYHQCGQQFIPENGGLKMINRYWGDQNRQGQLYWRRNVTFEPSRDSKTDIINNSLNEINVAFRWGKPAVINSHRVNFSGGIVKENRDNTIKLLKTLLDKIVSKWPDVEFMTSDQLGQYMTETKNNQALVK